MLAISDLHVAYGQSEVLHGLNVSVAPNEIVAIMGRNGMGKTTLMKSLMGILPTKSGSVSMNGAELSALPSYERVAKGLAYVPQGRMIFSTMTVQENIETGLTVTGTRKVPQDLVTICHKCLEKNPADRYPNAAELAEDLERFRFNVAISKLMVFVRDAQVVQQGRALFDALRADPDNKVVDVAAFALTSIGC